MIRFRSAILSILTAITALGAVSGWGQTLPIYINDKDFYSTTPPQIDARAFVNQALFSVSTSPLPFETQNTLYFTNKGSGVMTGTVGFRFNYYNPTTNLSLPANTFVNNGTITGDPYLIISATNVINTGLLFSSSAGLIHVDGSNINLSKSGLRAGDMPQNSGLIINEDGRNMGTNYLNSAGVIDYWWGVGTNNLLGTNGRPINFTGFGEQNFDIPYTYSPYHQVRFVNYGRLNTNTVQLPYFSFSGNYAAAAYTNVSPNGDRYIDVVFYQTNTMTTNFSTTVQFYSSPGNGAVAIVGIAMVDYDIVLQSNILSYVYLIDSSSVVTNFALYRQQGTNTFRPNVFELTRSVPLELLLGFVSGPNTVFTNTLLYNTNYVTNAVNVLYAGYAAYVNETNVSQPLTILNNFGNLVANPAISDPTNSVGRIEIESQDLNLINTRVRAERFLSVKAKNIVSNRLAQVDAPIINYDIGTTNRTLELSNIVRSTVNRLSGAIAAYSAVWTNQVLSTVTNIVFTNGVFSNVVATITNTDHFHILIVDNALTATKQVVLNEFAVRATNVVLYDNLLVSKSLYVGGEGLRIARTGVGVAGLALPATSDWSQTIFPNLKSLTNEGYLTISGSGYFYRYSLTNLTNGAGIPGGINQTNQTNQINYYPYDWVINSGSITGATFYVMATNLIHTGAWSAAQGVFEISAAKASLANGSLYAKSDLTIEGRELNLSNSVLIAGNTGRGALTLHITNSLTDGGANSTNIIQVNDGLSISGNPAYGDLRNTIIYSKADQFAEVTHTFSAKNLGLTSAGFENNLAIGSLILDGADLSRIVLRGSGANDAVYVDYLELRNNATNYNSAIYIETNLTVYFANANLPVRKLNGAFGGRLRWIPTYAGKFSSTRVTLPNGQTAVYNSAVLSQSDLDSDRDGIPNLYDPTPMPTDADIDLKVNMLNQKTAQIRWNALSRSTNWLEFTTDVVGGQWRLLTNFVNSGAGTKANYVDVSTNGLMRFYRVRMDMTLP
ncbi:MAG: hypothetical protein ACP5T0_09990 [Verrucomicrobiia bacterium]